MWYSIIYWSSVAAAALEPSTPPPSSTTDQFPDVTAAGLQLSQLAHHRRCQLYKLSSHNHWYSTPPLIGREHDVSRQLANQHTAVTVLH